jgi:hypothetical protein
MRLNRIAVAGVVVLGAVACGQSAPVGQPTPTPVVTSSTSPSASPTALPTALPTTASPRPVVTRSPTPSPTASKRPTYSPRPVSPSPKPKPKPVVTTSPSRPLPAGDHSLFVLGDSVLISAEPYVRSALNGWVVTYDAVGSRRLPQGIQTLKARRDEIGRVVVIQQGNNYIAAEGSFGDQIDQAMRVLRGTSRVVWLTVAEKWASRVEINRQIRAAASRWPTIVVGDWARLVAAHPEYAGDQLHLSPEGRRAIARLIDQCVGPAP